MKPKKLLAWLLTLAMFTILIPSFTLTAGAAEVGACTADSCTGTYTNGFCSVDSTHYEAAQQVSETHHPELNSTHNGYYAIENAGQLYWFADKVNNDYNNYRSANAILTDNINANPGYTFTFIPDTGLVEVKKDSTVIAYIGTGSMGDSSGENTTFDTNASVAATLYDTTYTTAATELLNGLRTWTPIAPSSNYMGTFDGGEYAVSGLYVIGNTGDYVGLFGKVFTGKVQNVGVVNSYFLGSYAGGIAGLVASMATSETITNCYNNATVNNCSVDDSEQMIGGIVGSNRGGIITYCYNDGVISAYGKKGTAGGIVGQSEMSGKVENCYNNGRINSNVESNTAGGIAGVLSGTMTNCYNTGAVNAIGTAYGDVGGVVGGAASGTMTNCYNTGAVNVIGTAYCGVGGVVGHDSGCTITNCYNTGAVSTSGTGNPYVGSIVGEESRTYTNCYYLNTSCTSAGGGISKTAEEFASGEVAYLLNGDQTNIVWGQEIGVDKYPVLGGEKVYLDEGIYYNEITEFAIKSAGASESKATATVAIPTSGTYTLIFADYDGERLNKVDTVTVTVTGPKTVVVTSEIDITLSAGDKIMLWNDLVNYVPLCEEYIVE